ncbi:hypothetical protein [Helicobacter sp. T3_23-1056]
MKTLKKTLKNLLLVFILGLIPTQGLCIECDKVAGGFCVDLRARFGVIW